MPAEGSSRKPKTQTQSNDEWSVLGKPGVLLDAEAAKVVWCRVKGYPWWPAQVLSKAAARQHLGSVTHKSKSDAPVIFFGTSEIAWIGAKDVANWDSGMAQSFHNKGRKNKKFVVALEQVREFLSLTTERVAPSGWWCAPPAHGARAVTEEPVSSDDGELEQEHPTANPSAAAAAAAAASIPQPAPQLQHLNLTHSERQGSFGSGERPGDAAVGGGSGGGAGSFAAAAVAAAAALTADRAADLQDSAAAAAVMQRNLSGPHRNGSGRMDDAQPNSFSSRSAATHKSACQQIWGGGGGSMTGHTTLEAEQQQALGRHQRKRRATRQLYDTGSEASESDGSEHAAAGRARTSALNGRSISASRPQNGSRGRGTSAVAAAAAAAAAAAVVTEDDYEDDEGQQLPDFLVVKKRRLLQAEGDAAGSDNEATDLEALALAAMAMTQLASGAGSWDPPAQQQPAAPMHHMQEAAAAGAAPADEAMEDAAVVPVVPCKAEDAADAASGPQPSVAAAVQPPRYEHCGQGLPCAHTWQYSVPMPGCSVPAAAPPAAAVGSDSAAPGAAGSSTAAAAADSSMEQAAVQQAAVPAAAAAPSSEYYVHLFTGFAGSSVEDLEGQQGSDEAAGTEQQELGSAEASAAAEAATAVVESREGEAEVAGLAGLQALAAGAVALGCMPPPAAVAAANGLYPNGLLGAGMFSTDPAAAAAATVTAAAAAAGSIAQLRTTELQQQHIAAANAAICAAFSVSASAAGLHGNHQRHNHHAGLPHQHQHNGISAAAVSDRSAGSAGLRVGASGSSFSSKRRNAAAAAAALAASHVLTPPSPALDAAVAELLLRPDGPRLPLQQGLPDTGFTLPRELLLNRAPKFEWLKRNTFVSRERPKRLAKQDVHVCNCRPKRLCQPDGSEVVVGCTENCLNRLSYIHCDPRTCPCGLACTNKPFHQLKAPALEVFLTENRGHGVRMTQPLDKGQFVVEYAGEVIDQGELQRRMDAARDSGEQHFYIMELAPGLYIDAKKKGNHARLLNSSCDPNCETQKWRDAATGEVRIGIFTTRPVQGLEELTYDYMFEHSGVGALARGFKCMCGAKNCRGTMDINPDRKRDWGRRLDVFWEGDGVYYRGTVTGYSITSGKHTIMYDDGDVERVKLTDVPHRWLDAEHSPGRSALAATGSPADRALAGAAGDSGSWSQTDHEGSWDDGTGPTGGAAGAPMPSPIGLRMGRPALASSPLRPASAASAGDDAVAADALVTLGLAAEAELEQQQHQPASRMLLQQHDGRDGFARPAAKKQRVMAGPYGEQQARYDAMQYAQHHMHPGLSRAQQQWQHSSSSSQSAGGQYGMCGVLDGHSPISPPGQKGFQPFKPTSNLRPGASAMGLQQNGWASIQQQQQQLQRGQRQQQQHRGAGRGLGLDSSDSQGEFLPWEQLLSGIRAIKTQGPPLFQSSGVVAPAGHQPKAQQQQQPRQSQGAAFGGVASKFGRLLDLVGQVQPDIQQTVQQKVLPQQQQQYQQQQQRMAGPTQQPPPLVQAGRSGSWGGSSTSSAASCQLPLFCAVNAQMSALLLQQQALQHMVSPRAAQQQQQQQQMPPPPPQQPASQLPPVHPQHQLAQQQQHKAVAASAATHGALPASAVAVAAALQGFAAAANSTAGLPAQHIEAVGTAASFTKPRQQAAAAEQRPQQQQNQVVPDCVRAAAPDADSRAAAAAAAAAAVVQACCAGQAVLGTAGSGGSTARADSGLASAAAAAAAAGGMPSMQPAAGRVDVRQAQAVVQ